MPNTEYKEYKTRMEEAAVIMEYEAWLDLLGDELWAKYFEDGANYDAKYEDWCEDIYNKANEQE